MAKIGGYKGKLLEEVKSLSEGRVKAVADFAAYLQGKGGVGGNRGDPGRRGAGAAGEGVSESMG